jgi:EAL domain-containing protein (putative c-di-GMP-specific phosphodiesterase class I)
MGVDFVQGYHLGRPQPLARAVATPASRVPA